jgi:ATP-dependent DNA ligase
MLLAPAEAPEGEAWALEIKWDGCRAQLRYDGRAVSLRTRAGRECYEASPSWPRSPARCANTGSRSM